MSQKEIVSASALAAKTSYPASEIESAERLFSAYRSIVAMLFNFVQSGHPGGSISMGRSLLNITLNKNTKLDITDLDRSDSDIIGMAAGHKALGLYSYLGLLFEIVKIKDPKLFESIKRKMRFEDLLGFRKNPATELPLMKKFSSKRLDGHPTPETPGVVVATGASGVGFGALGGYAFAKKEYYDAPPTVNIVEGEGGMTPGRVHENLAHFWALDLWNLIIHVDWNNASIDADNVCATDKCRGQYVNWSPHTLGALHGLNVVYVEDGRDPSKVRAAQDHVFGEFMSRKESPNMIVYRTVKGEGYWEGRKSHGAGFKTDAPEYFAAQKTFEDAFNVKMIRAPEKLTLETREEYLYKNLLVVEQALKSDTKLVDYVFNALMSSRDALNKAGRKPAAKSADISSVKNPSDKFSQNDPPSEILHKPGSAVTLRESLGNTLHYLNARTGGGFYGFAADLVGSTSLNLMCEDFQKKGFLTCENPYAKIIPTGICEDGGSALISGISATGHYVGVGSSYATFMSPMGFTAARLFAIAYQAKHGAGMAPMILINAHAGLKTGEDGPTHACPQTLSLWKGFDKLNVKVVTLTPWDPNEIWPLMIAALKLRPAVILPYVTRPSETVVDREKTGLPPATAAADGIYRARTAKKSSKTVIYQGAEVGTELPGVLAALDRDNVDVNILYVASSELFSSISARKREEILPEDFKKNAMAVTGFTIDTMYEYLLSEEGRAASLHPFKKGVFLGSGPGSEVLKQAGLDAAAQVKAIKEFVGK